MNPRTLTQLQDSEVAHKGVVGALREKALASEAQLAQEKAGNSAALTQLQSRLEAVQVGV